MCVFLQLFLLLPTTIVDQMLDGLSSLVVCVVLPGCAECLLRSVLSHSCIYKQFTVRSLGSIEPVSGVTQKNKYRSNFATVS